MVTTRQQANPKAQQYPSKILYDKAQAALNAGEGVKAEQICRQALKKYAKDPNIHCLLGEIVIHLHRPQEAEARFRKVINRFGELPRALEQLGLSILLQDRPVEAVSYLQRALKADPSRERAQMALGRALALLGQGAEADQAFEAALALDPERAELARAADEQRQGNANQAEKILRGILAKDADNVNALRLLGNIATESNRWRAAQKLLERALELAPDFVLAWDDLANLLMQQERFDEALGRVQHALGLDPDFAHSWVIRGNILSKAQRHVEAVAAYDKALAISPGQGGALSGKGHVLKTIGQQEEAIATFRECIKDHPAFGEAYWSLANLKTFEFLPAEVKTMSRFVAEQALGDEPRVNFMLSLGKHYENEKDYDRAFEYYRQGNELRRGHEIYDPVQTEIIHDRIIDVFSHEFFVAKAGWGEPDPAPILIVGLPRSGSTLIEQILASHSEVEGTMELPDLSRTIRAQDKKRQDGVTYPDSLLNLTADDARVLGQRYLESTERYRSGSPFFIDKMPNNFSAVGFLHLILPNARVINARRHPLDSCLGCYKQLFFKGQSFTYDLFELGQYYLEYQRIMDHWHKVLPGKVLDVNYADLVADQEGQTRRILEYCDLPFEEQCLRFYETERAVNTASSEQVRKPIYTKAVNFWRHYEAHLEELIEVLGPLLRELPEVDQPGGLRR